MVGRPKKYNEDVRMQSILLPDSIDLKLKEKATKKGISKNAYIIATLLKGLDAEDLESFIDEFIDNLDKKEKPIDPETEQKVKQIIIDETNEYIKTGQITNKIRSGASKTEIISVFAINLILPKVLIEIDTQELDFPKKLVEKKVNSYISNLYDEYER
jgi:hypothetical protein